MIITYLQQEVAKKHFPVGCNQHCYFVSYDKKDFPQQISKVMRSNSVTGENWFVDFKAGNVKYIVFYEKILKYQIGNQAQKEAVCNECRKLGILDEQMN